MSIRIDREELALITGGKTVSSKEKLQSFGLEFDSRNIKGGELFVALKGESAHGHQYLNEVFSRGASLALIEDSRLLQSFSEPERLVCVPDTLRAFWNVATWWRRKLGLPIVAITGSVGKTTVKELISSILLQHSVGSYALKSFNNHVGVPYTLCRMSPEHQWGVVEVGMNHPGEIESLSKIVEPDVAVVTEVQAAHIGAFQSVEGIAREKLSIGRGLKGDGKLVINGDNEYIEKVLPEFSYNRTILRFGTKNGVDCMVSEIKTDPMKGIEFDLKLSGENAHIVLSVIGKHNARNAAGAALSSQSLIPELSLGQIEKGLKAFRAPLMRLNLKEMKEGRRVLDDSYNANPGSMKALLDIAAEMIGDGLKVGLVLGDMLELGSFAPQYHRELGIEVSKISPAFVVAVGEYKEEILKPCREQSISAVAAENPETAARIVQEKVFDIVLVKGSRGVRLDKVVNILVQE